MNGGGTFGTLEAFVAAFEGHGDRAEWERLAGAVLARSFGRGHALRAENRYGRAETRAIPGAYVPKTGTGAARGPAAGAAPPRDVARVENRDGATETRVIPGAYDAKTGTGAAR